MTLVRADARRAAGREEMGLRANRMTLRRVHDDFVSRACISLRGATLLPIGPFAGRNKETRMQTAPPQLPAADDAWTARQLERTSNHTRDAVRALGAPPELAEAVAQGGGLMVDDWFATVSVLPIREGRGDDAAPVLVTLNTQRELASLTAEELLGLMALSSTLLAHQAAVGFTPEGRLCLNRVVPPEAANAAGIEQAIRHVWHLARLLWDAPPAQGAQ